MFDRFIIIAGPCVAESYDVCMRVAEKVVLLQDKKPSVDFIFKASWDKANRSNPYSYRGPENNEGLDHLRKVKEEFGLKILTDVHETGEMLEKAASVADILQVPAFLCRQTDLIKACCETGKVVNVKKGQFLSPEEAKGIVVKLDMYKAKDFFVTERGTTFGYNNLVVDFRGIEIMRKFSKVIFDATHSVQLPGGLGSSSGGQREFAYPLAKAAIAVGVSGLFFEVHPDPDNALCDGPNQIELWKFEHMIMCLMRIREFFEEEFI